MDDGPERISDAGERAAVRLQALRVVAKSAAGSAVIAAALFLLG